jgi:hypothetical protein
VAAGGGEDAARTRPEALAASAEKLNPDREPCLRHVGDDTAADRSACVHDETDLGDGVRRGRCAAGARWSFPHFAQFESAWLARVSSSPAATRDEQWRYGQPHRAKGVTA